MAEEASNYQILLEGDTGGESFLQAAPLLADALSIVRSATLLSVATKYVAEQNELFPAPLSPLQAGSRAMGDNRIALDQPAGESSTNAAFVMTYKEDGYNSGAVSTLFAEPSASKTVAASKLGETPTIGAADTEPLHGDEDPAYLESLGRSSNQNGRTCGNKHGKVIDDDDVDERQCTRHAQCDAVLNGMFEAFSQLRLRASKEGNGYSQQQRHASPATATTADGVNPVDEIVSELTDNSSPTVSLHKVYNGLIVPDGVHIESLLEAFPMLAYEHFAAKYNQLFATAGNGVLYTAASSRLKILQGQYRLHRAFNGQREDQFHPTLGCGDFTKAAKVDIRNSSTCMSAETLVGFMNEKLEKEPDGVVSVRRGGTTHVAVVDGEGDCHESSQQQQHLQDALGATKGAPPLSANATPKECVGQRTTLRQAVNAFFGPHVSEEERVFTAEGLGLLPNYTEATPKWLDLFARDDPTRPRARHAGKLLRHFLKLDCGNRGHVLAEILQRTIGKITRQPTDLLELELALHGRSIEETLQAARWCSQHNLLAMRRRVRLTLRISLVDFTAKYPARTLNDVLCNIFVPLWHGLLDSARYVDLASFLRLIDCVSVSADCKEAAIQTLPPDGDPTQYGLTDAADTYASMEAQDIAAPLRSPIANFISSSGCNVGSTIGENTTVQNQPPIVFLIYHVWRNVMLLNSFIASHLFFHNAVNRVAWEETRVQKQTVSRSSVFPGTVLTDFIVPRNSVYRSTAPLLCRPFLFRLHTSTSNATSFAEAVAGLLLADQVVNPADIFEWCPLAYLYYMTQRCVILTPSRSRTSSAHAPLRNAVPFVVESGLNAFVASMDPLHYHTSDDALCEEYNFLLKTFTLAGTDVTEMCARSVEMSNLSLRDRGTALGTVNGTKLRSNRNEFTKSNLCSLRLHFREVALEHEVSLLCRAAEKGWKHRTALGADAKANGSSSSADATGAHWSSNNTPRATFKRWQQELLAFYDIPRTGVNADNEEVGIWGGESDADVAASKKKAAASCETQASYLQRPPGPFRERRVQFPRFEIQGPGGLSLNDAARKIASAMARRYHYQQYSVVSTEEYGIASKTAKEGTKASSGGQACPTSFVQYIRQLRKFQAECDLHLVGDLSSRSSLAASQPTIRWKSGVLDVTQPESEGTDQKRSQDGNLFLPSVRQHYFTALPTWEEFQSDCRALRALSRDPAVQTYSKKRLSMLECKFILHSALTEDDDDDYVRFGEDAHTRSKTTPSTSKDADISVLQDSALVHSQFLKHRPDMYSAVKVDVHCHMASGVTAKSLLLFIQEKLRKFPDDVVWFDTKKRRNMTLAEMFRSLGYRGFLPKPLTLHPCCGERASSVKEEETTSEVASDLTVASLNVQASRKTFNRFDDFNGRYNPFGVKELRSIFLKTDNDMGGRYFAELIKRSFEKQRDEGSSFSEFRLSIYGRSKNEWESLAQWFVTHEMVDPTNRWMVQVPRLYHIYKREKLIANFEEMLRNIFEPLWEASMYPEKYPMLDYFLSHVSGFDSVDNESDRETDALEFTTPENWTRADNPPFMYWMYYMWANITTLNRFRATRNLSIFHFRPHAGESGDPDHMADVFLVADGVNHGINVVKRPPLHFLFYLAQIPLGIVPLSNNSLFCKFRDNPFPTFFRQGLNVALSTDGWLQFHHTQQPLIEEYGTAAKFWELSPVDMCEIAQRSVVMSGFPDARKAEWLGPLFFLQSILGNDQSKSYVPYSRCCFRYEVYLDEVRHLENRAAIELRGMAYANPQTEELLCLGVLGMTRADVLDLRIRRWLNRGHGAEKQQREKTVREKAESGSGGDDALNAATFSGDLEQARMEFVSKQHVASKQRRQELWEGANSEAKLYNVWWREADTEKLRALNKTLLATSQMKEQQQKQQEPVVVGVESQHAKETAVLLHRGKL